MFPFLYKYHTSFSLEIAWLSKIFPNPNAEIATPAPIKDEIAELPIAPPITPHKIATVKGSTIELQDLVAIFNMIYSSWF